MSLDTYIKNFGPALKAQEYNLSKDKKLYCFQTATENSQNLTFISDLANLTLHWGVGIKNPTDWSSPLLLKDIFINLPESIQIDKMAAQSKFFALDNNLNILEIVFKKENVPKQLNFVIKIGNSWFNNNGKNYAFFLKNANNNPESQNNQNNVNNTNINELINKIIEVEVSDNSWTLMHRFNMCNEWLNRLSHEPKEILAWIFVWMRYSSIRKLAWQRKYNTQPREVAHSQKNLSLTLTNLIASASKDGLISKYHVLSLIMGTFGKGGDNGQKIRDQILEIMHKHHVKEEKNNFYEQWHQKLHNNTTPDDVGICEAVIAFNKTNKIEKYWEVLHKHGITKERLASFERPIILEPLYAPNLVSDLTLYLETLNSIHSGNNLALNIKNAYKFISGDIQKLLDEILANINDFDKIKQMERVVSIRVSLNKIMEKLGNFEYREVLYLDMSLEAYIRQIAEAIIHLELPLLYFNKMITLLLENAALNCNHKELSMAIEDWKFFTIKYKNTIESNKENALIIKSVADRIKRILGQAIDIYMNLFDDKAKFLGNAFKIDSQTIAIFSEEILRGSIFFSISLAFKQLDLFFKKIGILNSCNIISNFPDQIGQFFSIPSLSQAPVSYSSPTILLVKKVSGEEEIPVGVVAIISMSELDVLAHISIRARNSQTLLITCQDEEITDAFRNFDGGLVKVIMLGGKVKLEKADNFAKNEVKYEVGDIKLGKIEPLNKEFLIKSEQFAIGRTGYKSINCGILKTKLPEFIGVPESLAFPFGLCEYILNLNENQEKRGLYENEIANLKGENDFSNKLKKLKEIINSLIFPKDFENYIDKTLISFNFTLQKNQVDKFFSTLKKVWASKFNERAYISTLKTKIPFNDIRMSVLCQNVIPANYAFVLHTKDPINNNYDQIYGELVIGLGETLVGAYEGRAFSFIANKNDEKFNVLSFPNKSVALKGQGIILRSDSNCEDLKGFAGAGLFDSVMVEEAKEIELSYSEENLMIDEKFRNELMRKLREVAIYVEKVFNDVPQDIEGVIRNDKVYVVQSRPQI